MARKLVSYEDMIAEAGPSDLAKVQAQADQDSDGLEIDDDEVAPLPSGVKKPPSKDGKLTISAKKRLRKKRRLEKQQKAQASQDELHRNPDPKEQQPGQKSPVQTSAPAPAHEAQKHRISLDEQQDDQTKYVTDSHIDHGLADADYQYDEAYDENYADEEYYEDEEYYDEDEDFLLNTNVTIPDIPAHFRTNNNGSTSLRNPRLPETAPAMPDVPDPTGRILHDDEICSDSAIVDAWSAACVSLFRPTQASKNFSSALWNFAPLPGSASDKKMTHTAEMNREKRRLQKFVQTQQQHQAKAVSGGQASSSAAATKQPSKLIEGAQEQQAPSPKKPTIQTQRAGAAVAGGRNASASPAIFKLNRAIPPSIGLEGNAAWQAACAKVASTRNRIGPPVLSSAQTTARPQPSLTNSAFQPGPQLAQLAHAPHIPALPPLPANVGAEQETLHHICTSWYQAGYYTGLLQAQTAGGQQRDGQNAAATQKEV